MISCSIEVYSRDLIKTFSIIRLGNCIPITSVEFICYYFGCSELSKFLISNFVQFRWDNYFGESNSPISV